MTSLLAPAPPALRGYRFHAVAAHRWRVLDRRGRIIGHLRSEERTEGVRYHAERFELARARMRQLGAFWTVREAVECLNYLR